MTKDEQNNFSLRLKKLDKKIRFNEKIAAVSEVCMYSTIAVIAVSVLSKALFLLGAQEVTSTGSIAKQMPETLRHISKPIIIGVALSTIGGMTSNLGKRRLKKDEDALNEVLEAVKRRKILKKCLNSALETNPIVVVHSKDSIGAENNSKSSQPKRRKERLVGYAKAPRAYTP